MKQKLQKLSFIAILILVNACSAVFGQTATATWALTADPSVATTGTISAIPQSVSGITVTSYTAYNGPLGVPSQRSRVTSGWPQSSAYVSTRYYEYALTVSSGSFNSVNISLPMGAVSTGNLRANVFYSTDNFATSTPADTSAYIQLPNGSYVSPTPTYAFNLPLTTGSTFSVRVFPWYTGSDLSTSRYVVMQNVVISLSTATLPLKLLSFNSLVSGDKVKLSWSASNEINMQRYELEKRTDITNFSSIGNVAANNKISTSNYSFEDNKGEATKTYYRLKMVDKDGSYSYSSVLAVTRYASLQLSLYPNPVINTIILNHPKASAKAAVRIVDLNGKIVSEVQAQEFSTQSSFDVSKLSKGNYLLQFSDTGEIIGSLKFVKQ